MEFSESSTAFWDTKIISDEPVMMFKFGEKLRGTLLFPPKKIISVKKWTENGYIEVNLENQYQTSKDPESKRTYIEFNYSENKEIPYIEEKDILREPNSENSYPASKDKKNWLIFSETGLFTRKQLLITYEYSDEQYKDVLNKKILNPIDQSISDGFINKFQKNISTSDGLDLLILGDSISYGCNSTKQVGIKPLLPNYAEILIERFKEKYPKLNFNLKNSSVGGKDSRWGSKIIKKIIKQEKRTGKPFGFHLNIIAFGANDASGCRKPEEFKKYIQKIVKNITKYNQNAQFILVGSSLTNTLWSGSQNELLFSYIEKLDELAANNPNIITSNISSLWSFILENKKYYDITGNGLNHPNDFGHNLYADYIWRQLNLIKP